MEVLLPSVDPNVITALAAAGGAITIKVVERWLGRRNDDTNEAERIRKELREELNRYRNDNIQLEKELDQMRVKYWKHKKLYDSDEIRVSDLQTEIITSALQIKTLGETVQSLQDAIEKLQKNYE